MIGCKLAMLTIVRVAFERQQEDGGRCKQGHREEDRRDQEDWQGEGLEGGR